MARSRVFRRPMPGRRQRPRTGRDRGPGGAVVLEFALVVPMLLLLVFGTIEFGYMLNRDMIVSNASRDGARGASLNDTYAEILRTVDDELAASGIAKSTQVGGGTTVAIDCKKVDNTACNASVGTYDGLAESGTTATIRVTYTYRWITPLVSSLFGESTLLEQTTEMRVE